MPAIPKASLALCLLPPLVSAMPVQEIPSDAIPPARFQVFPTEAYVLFTEQEQLEQLCGKATHGKRMACSRSERIVMPNPCTYANKGEYYARIMCHELAHRHSWTARHEP